MSKNPSRRFFLHQALKKLGIGSLGILGLNKFSNLWAQSIEEHGGMYPNTKARGRVIVVGGGFGGTITAKYLRLWSGGALEVILVEPKPQFISCPLSNLVLGGTRKIGSLTFSYAQLDQYGIKRIQDEVITLDPIQKKIRLKQGGELSYDRIVLSPGIGFIDNPLILSIHKTENAPLPERLLHAWHAGEQTVLLRQQLETMPDGGVCVISIPKAPYRCPPGPYERICQIAWYFRERRPRNKIIVLDANPEIQSKKAFFEAQWKNQYAKQIEYHINAEVVAVDSKAMTVSTDLDEEIRGDVLNIIPPQRAGDIAFNSGMANVNKRWCAVNWLTMESTVAPNVHIIGDAVMPGPSMPKSGHIATQHGRVTAGAIVSLMSGAQPNPSPIIMNTCYSFIDPERAIHVASVHTFDRETATMRPVVGAGGLSAIESALEGSYAQAWARNIWQDMLG